MTGGLAVLFGVTAFGLVIAGAFMSDKALTDGEQWAGLVTIIAGGLMSLGAIILALIAVNPDFWS